MLRENVVIPSHVSLLPSSAGYSPCGTEELFAIHMAELTCWGLAQFLRGGTSQDICVPSHHFGFKLVFFLF